MNISAFDRSPQSLGRVAGWCYLAIILLGLFGEMFVRATLVVPGDAAGTVANIAASPSLWRAGIAGDLLMHVLDVPVTLILYLMLRPVNKGLALWMTLLNMVQTAVLAANKLTLVVPLLLLNSVVYPKVFSAEQLGAMSYLAIQAHGYGFGIGLIFFGVTCLVRGYLMFKSGYFPKALGVLIVLAGVCYLVNSFALLLAPAVAAVIFPAILLPAFVAELSLTLWLIVRGVNVEQWQRRTGIRAALP